MRFYVKPISTLRALWRESKTGEHWSDWDAWEVRRWPESLMMLLLHPCHLQKGPLDLIDTGKGLKVQTDKPHLVSLGSGRLSTAITLLPLEEGK